MKIRFISNAVRYFDRNGNTYHSVTVWDAETGKKYSSPVAYGYGNAYEQTAILLLAQNNLIDPKYINAPHLYQRENEYNILFLVHDGTKKEMRENAC